MMRIFFLILNAGLSLALQHPLEYKYQYQGSIFTGIPEINKQTVALSLKGDLIAKVIDDGTVLMKLDENSLLFSEHHGEAPNCNNEDFPGEFRHFEEGKIKRMLSAPIKAHLFDGSNNALEVPEDEETAFTSLKKGMVAAFRNELLNSNFETSSGLGTVAHRIRGGDVPPVFTVEEETIYGICDVEYTVNKVPDHLGKVGNLDYLLKKQMEVDVQRDESSPFARISGKSKTSKTSKTSKKYRPRTSKKHSSKSSKKSATKVSPISKPATDIPDIADDLWHVVKSINFDKCRESVVFHNIKIGIVGDPAVGQYESLGGRSSVTEYIIRGSGGAFRVEKASIHGVHTLSPYGPQAETLEIKTEQTLRLSVVDNPSTSIKQPEKTKHITTWMQQLVLPLDEPKISRILPWVIYKGKGPDGTSSVVSDFHGFQFPKLDDEAMKGMIIGIIQNLSKVMVDTNGEHSANLNPSANFGLLQLVGYYIVELSEKDLKEIVKKFMVDPFSPEEKMARKLVVDILALGHEREINILLDLIKEDELDKLHEISIYMTALHNMKYLTGKLKFLDHILNIDLDEYPFLGSTALINIVASLRQACFHNIDQPMFEVDLDNNNCRTKIKTDLFPYIKNLIYDGSHWKQILGLSALRELQTPFALKIVPDIIYKDQGSDLTRKKVALTLLERWNIPYVVRSQAMVFLENVYNDVALHPQIRQTALYALVSWGPDAHFFYRLAKSTWREPSKEMVIFINGLIKALASNPVSVSIKVNQAASHAEKFLRPISLSYTQRHSYIIRDIRDQLERQFLSIKENTWITTEDSHSSHATSFFKSIINGFHLEIFSMYKFITESVGVMEPKERESAESIARRIASTLYDKIQETVNVEPSPIRESSFDVDVHLTFLKHMNLYLPINEENSASFLYFDPVFQGTFLTMAATTGYESTYGKMMIPIEEYVYLPTDLGMPFISTMLVSDIFSSQSVVRVTKGEESLSDSKASIDVAYKEMFQVQFSLQISSAFTEVIFGPMLRTDAEINLPLALSGSLSHASVKSLYDKKFVTFKASNSPITFYAPLPLGGSKPYEEKIIQAFEPSEKKVTVPFLGLDAEVSWRSQLSSPMEVVDPEAFKKLPLSFDIFRPRTIKGWSLSVSYDPEHARTKSITASWNRYVGDEPIQPISQFGQEAGEFSQYGQETGEFSQFGQETGEFSQFGQETGEFDDFGQQSHDFDQVEDFGVQQISGAGVQEGGHIFSKLTLADSPADRLKKLETYLDDGTQVFSLKIEGEGAVERSVEYFFAFPKIIVRGDRQKKQMHFALIRSAFPESSDEPLKLCIDYSREDPKFSRLSTLASVFASELDAKIDISLKENCGDKNMISVKGTAVMSDGAKERVAANLAGGECSADPLQVGLFKSDHYAGLMEGNFIYDNIHYEIEWQKLDENRNKMIVVKAIAKGFEYFHQFLKGEHLCSFEGPSGKLEVSLDRCGPCGSWKLSSGPRFELLVQNEFINDILDLKYSLRGTKQIIDYVTPSSNPKCFITDKSVSPMSGDSFEFQPTNCWTVAMMECNHVDHMMILVKESSTEHSAPEVRYINKKTAVVVDLGKFIRVNGKIIDPIEESEVVRDNSGHILATVYKNDQARLVEVSEVIIAVTDKVIITVKNTDFDTCGVCGNHHDIMGGMIGPHNCIYHDSKLFADVWTGPSDQCDLYSILDLRSKAETYQKTCTSLGSAMHEHFSKYPEAGFTAGWRLHRGEKHYCISDMPLAYCKEGFESFSESQILVDFRCYQEGRVPSALLKAFEQDLIYTDMPPEGTPHKQEKRKLYIEDSCRKTIK